MAGIDITKLTATADTRRQLRDIIIEAVAHGGSVNFMHPLEPKRAAKFWRNAFAKAGREERVILGAWDGDVLAATVTVILDCPPNQPHRAEIGKMMTRVSHRKQGIGAALVRAAEKLAAEKKRTLLILDTAEEDGAAGFYEKLGYTLAGRIPDYALKPHGGLSAAKFCWKRI